MIAIDSKINDEDDINIIKILVAPCTLFIT